MEGKSRLAGRRRKVILIFVLLPLISLKEMFEPGLLGIVSCKVYSCVRISLTLAVLGHFKGNNRGACMCVSGVSLENQCSPLTCVYSLYVQD